MTTTEALLTTNVNRDVANESHSHHMLPKNIIEDGNATSKIIIIMCLNINYGGRIAAAAAARYGVRRNREHAYYNIMCAVTLYLSSSSCAIADGGSGAVAVARRRRGAGPDRTRPPPPPPPPPEQSDNCRFARRLIVYDRRCPRTRRTAVGGSRYTRTAARQHNNNNKRTTTTARAPHDTRTGCRYCRTRPRRIRHVRLSLSPIFLFFFFVAFSLSSRWVSVITRHRRQVSP